MAQAKIPEGRIDLGLGQPQLSHLPKEILFSAVQSLFHEEEHRQVAIESLTYGEESGSVDFRLSIAKYLSRNGLGYEPHTSNLFVTNGASQAIEIICSTFATRGDVVLVEDPTYFLASGIFRDHGLRLVPMPLDHNGIDTAALDLLIERLNAEGTHPRLLYTIPSFQNPSGSTLPQPRREELCRLSIKYNFIIIADEVYQLLHFPAQPPPPPMTRIYASVSRTPRNADQTHGVVSVGSFSKILAPGLRLGWIEASAGHISQFANRGYVISGGGLNPFISAITQRALENGSADAHLENLRKIYAERCDVLCHALIESLGAEEITPQGKAPETGKSIVFLRPHGGYFVWVQFPSNVDTTRFVQFALATENVSFKQGALFAPSKDLSSNPNCIRLCFAHYEASQIREGIERIARAWKQWQSAQ